MKIIDTGRSKAGWSRIGWLLSCPYRWKLQADADAEGMPPASWNATNRGSLVHIAAAHYYTQFVDGYSPHEWYPWAEAMKASELGREMIDYDPVQFAYLTDLMASYIKFWEGENERSQMIVVAVEKEFEARIDDEPITYKCDLVFKSPSDVIYFCDHKTSSGTLTNLEHRYTLHGQMLLGTVIGKRIYGDKFGGVIINGIRTNIKIKNPQFYRKYLPQSPNAIQHFTKSIKHALRLKASLKGVPTEEWPRAFNEQVCHGRYGTCPHFNTCQEG